MPLFPLEFGSFIAFTGKLGGRTAIFGRTATTQGYCQDQQYVNDSHNRAV
jgi:hypothetical protein